ncbi:hypothetical protein PYCCODRAFT_1433530 [Trametes coccinea BRFM310]|uniref:Uncharacterized protein n=1 Tax=Trametes coccinea (strain BRFM310) TaxID=1353009 RepID=A0A1Y2IU53_TRAC3|nr:hypothetical protein PYCCODRAFT_1433530 [Trametes coccinea BRFM310]
MRSQRVTTGMPETTSGKHASPPSYKSSIPLPHGMPVASGDPTKTRRPRSSLARTLVATIGATLLALLLAQNLGLVRCPLNDVPAAEKAKLRAQWRVEAAEHQRESHAWTVERTEHEAEMREWVKERKAHDEEKEEWRRQREEEELHRLEVLRRSQGVYWTEPNGDAHCHAYGTRTYIAYLRDIPGDLNWREVCDYMPPVVIHGRALSRPDKCERNEKSEVVGVWYVDFDEPACRPYWGWIESKGCGPGQPGIERFEGRLRGIGSGEDWSTMCATAPATIGGVHFGHPSSCENRVRNSVLHSPVGRSLRLR